MHTMKRGEFTPVSTEEGSHPRKGVDLKRILMIAAVVLIGVIIVAVVIGVIAYFLVDSSGSSMANGMEYEPRMEDRLVAFVQGKPESYMQYTKPLEDHLLRYENENQVGENMVDCDYGYGVDKPEEKSCVYRLDNLGSDCTWQKDYGFDEGQPCILLTMDQVKNWVPEDLTNATLDSMPADVRARYKPGYIPFSCEGLNPADKDNRGNVKYYPPAGIPFYFFPYAGQEGYVNPPVFVRFQKPKLGVVITIQCKAWVANRDVSVAFYLMVD